MLFFATIGFRASTNISLNLFLNICLFYLATSSISNFFYFILLYFLFVLFSIASCIKFSLLQLILYLKEYVLLCYAIFDINIAKNSWLPHQNKTLPFNDFFCTNKRTLYFPVFDIVLSSERSTFPKFVWGTGQRLFFIFQNFTIY